MDDVFSITMFTIFNVGNFKGILSLIEYLWNNVYFVFVIFNNNLFALNHWLIFFSSQFTVSKKEKKIDGGNKKCLRLLQTLLGLICLMLDLGHLHRSEKIRFKNWTLRNTTRNCFKGSIFAVVCYELFTIIKITFKPFSITSCSTIVL